MKIHSRRPPRLPGPGRRPAAVKFKLVSRSRKAGRPAAAPAFVDPIAIDANRALLNRYRFVLHEGMRILAGWLPKAATLELKCEMGRTIWENQYKTGKLTINVE